MMNTADKCHDTSLSNQRLNRVHRIQSMGSLFTSENYSTCVIYLNSFTSGKKIISDDSVFCKTLSVRVTT